MLPFYVKRKYDTILHEKEVLVETIKSMVIISNCDMYQNQFSI